jgi:phospholipid/cholesterol/gamma-HCH transport system substrate-binding protein
MTPAAKIGLFMLLGLIILGLFIIKIEDIPVGERGERLVVQARFPDVAGLDKKAPVRIAGVRVGKVEQVDLAGGEAVLTLSLEPDVHLYRNATARISSLGMLGDKYVEVVPGTPEAGPLPPDSVLAGGSPPTFDDVLKIATDIGFDVKEVTAALRESAGGQQGAEKLSEIVENIRELSADLKALIKANQGNVNQTMANFRDFSGTLKTELPRIAEKMNRLADSLQDVVGENREDLHGSLANIRDLSARLKTTADNLNLITTRIANGEGTIGKLVNDETTVDNLNETLDSIESGVETLKNTVGRFERYRLDMTMASEALPGVDESRSTFGFDLWTNDRRFFRVEYVDSPFGRSKTKSETVTTTWGDGTAESYTRTTTKVDDTGTFNAQIGYRLLPETVFRAGLFESEGGVAVDHTLKVRERPLVLSLSAYDFDRQEDGSPHLRLEGRYYLNPNLFLSAGWDDPTYSEHSSVLVGAGLTWTDEDMKYLLGLAGRGF